jgi:16S rRNA (guanine966-N2)-methyltransferase
VRIIAGRHRGRRIAAPAGRDLRPTADRVRESVFNVLTHGGTLEGSRVLDAFAGTGAYGLEALSRGAEHADFLDSDRLAIAQCRANAEALGETARAAFHRADACHPPRAREASDIAFLDPPYRSGLAVSAIEALTVAGWLTEDAVCVVELAADESLAALPGFAVIDERRYGAARVVFLKRGASSA